MIRIIAAALLVAATLAKDPAEGWMAYAVGQIPAGVQRITRLDMKWKEPSAPPQSQSFYSPWFGMDPADELNLIQPVNPWVGSSWAAYTEYFQWSPQHNSNSKQISGVKPGQTLSGSLQYYPELDSYNLTQNVLETGTVSTQIVKCQSGKKFTVPYVVFEKVAKCNAYPPDGIVTFFDIRVGCDFKECTEQIKWTPKVLTPNCNMKAVINKAKNTIAITWDTKAKSKYDNMTAAVLYDLNMKGGGWATKLGLERPSE